MPCARRREGGGAVKRRGRTRGPQLACSSAHPLLHRLEQLWPVLHRALLAPLDLVLLHRRPAAVPPALAAAHRRGGEHARRRRRARRKPQRAHRSHAHPHPHRYGGGGQHLLARGTHLKTRAAE